MVAIHIRFFYVIAAWSKRTRIVFTVSELLPSHDKIYLHGKEKNSQLLTDLYVKPTDKDQYLHASFCYVYYSNKSMPYSQVVRLNRIFSENSYYDKRCNELVVWLSGCRLIFIRQLENIFYSTFTKTSFFICLSISQDCISS